MLKNPCKYCENKGCGVYHDECEAYQKFRDYRSKISDERAKSVETYMNVTKGAMNAKCRNVNRKNR